MQRIARWLQDFPSEIVQVPEHKDFGDYYRADKNAALAWITKLEAREPAAHPAKIESVLDQIAQPQHDNTYPVDDTLSGDLATSEPYELEVLRLSDVTEKPITWLWPGFIPRGKLTLLAGAPGTAKSTMSIDFASTLTRGGTWPDGTICFESGDALFWSSEDGVEDTIKPRLVAAGADCDRVYIPKIVTPKGQDPRPFDPACDIAQLRKLMERNPQIKLLVIDPVISAVTGDMHKANDVRRALQEIVHFAEDFDVSVVGITHFAKNSGGKNPAERVIGSQAFTAFARMVLVTVKDETTGECVVTRSKSNITTDTGGYRYHLEVVNYPDASERIIQTTKIAWGEPIEGSSRTILAEIEGGESGSSKVDMAKEFLEKEFKRQNTQQPTAIIAKAKEYGLGETSVRNAATLLGVIRKKTGFAGGWSWSYPSKMMDEDDNRSLR